METILIELKERRALNILRELEQLSLIKLLEEKTVSAQKMSEKYRGKLSSETAEAMHKHVQQMRNEWDRDI
jgi:hypothetical protein